MNAREAFHAQITSKIIRAGRKLRSKTQSDLARALDISQPTICKLESGELIPSMSQWHDLCDLLEIHPTGTFRLGVIDTCTVAGTPKYPDSDFNLPKRYLKHHGSTIRTTQPFVRFFEQTLGHKKLDEFLKSRKIDPDLFTVFDHPINIRFSIELSDALVRAGKLSLANLKELSEPVSKAEMHGSLQKIYKAAKNQTELMEILLTHLDRYDVNCTYAVEGIRGNSFFLRVSDNPRLQYFSKFRTQEVTTFLRHYRKSFIESASRIKGVRPASVDILEKSEKKGLEQCLFRIQTQ